MCICIQIGLDEDCLCDVDEEIDFVDDIDDEDDDYDGVQSNVCFGVHFGIFIDFYTIIFSRKEKILMKPVIILVLTVDVEIT